MNEENYIIEKRNKKGKLYSNKLRKIFKEEAIWESGFIDEKKKEYVEILSQLKKYIEDNFYTE